MTRLFLLLTLLLSAPAGYAQNQFRTATQLLITSVRTGDTGLMSVPSTRAEWHRQSSADWPNPVQNGPLRVSDNKRYLVHENGQPFYWMGDTAWELFHRLNREEAEHYLRKRAEQGFTVIQAVALAELNGLRDPNPYFEVPLDNMDPTRPREAYFQHVDWIIDKAAELGLYIALLPTWGDKLYKDSWGTGPEVFNPDNARVYGRWLGNRYKNKTNLIWVMMGDRNPRNETDVAVWNAMAEGVTEGVGSAKKPLITAHPQPNDMADGGAGRWFHDKNWYSFNMFQTGHCRENPIYDRIAVAYNRLPAKPTLDGESLYEDHPVCFNRHDLGTSNAYDVRIGAYWAVFAGAFGHTYGCHDIWQFYTPRREPINGAGIPWKEALLLPGAGQMQHLRKLMESRPMLERIPDQSLLVESFDEHDKVLATRGNRYAFVYTTKGKSFTVNMGKIKGKKVTAAWYSPRDGQSQPIGTFDNSGKHLFKPPASGYGQDWVLVLDGEE
jgi:Protein of unknown function (DUF4038)/Putative collagen-binding domain of a collagenase